ncbi:MAG: ABC transporter permease [Acidobacteria bacterium]|nr:ABC transporter permease [Acidobacteriota bacterium]
MNLRRTRAMARKEFLHIVRDPRSLIMALAMPLVMLLLFGFALSLDVDRVPTIVYDMDRSPQSRELMERFAASRFFQILESEGGYPSIESRINRSQCLLGVVIPQGYSGRLSGGSEAEIQLLVDGSDSNTAGIALGYAEALIQAYAFELRVQALDRKGGGRLRPAVEPRIRVWYNGDLKSKNYIVPGLIAVIMMIIASLLTSLTIAREWEMGTMEQLLSTPLRPAEIVLGKLSAFFVVGVADMLIAIGVGVFVFDVPLRGSVTLLFLTGCVFLFGSLCWGIFLSAATRSQLQAYQLGTLTSFLPAFLLSGFIYAFESMPAVVRLLTYFVPARYFVTIVKGIFLKGIGTAMLGTELALLLGYAAIVFMLATRKLKQKIA